MAAALNLCLQSRILTSWKVTKLIQTGTLQSTRMLRPWSNPVNTTLYNGGLRNLSTKTTDCCQSSIHRISHRISQVYSLVSRSFHKGKLSRSKPTKLPFEVDANVPRDTLLYKYSNDKFYKVLTVFGIVQFFFWGNMAVFSYSGMKALTTEEGQAHLDTESWWGKVFLMQAKYKMRIAVGCMVVGYLVMFFTWLYPQRTICTLSLLRGGQSVRIQTYTHFGRKREFTVPLEHMNFKQNRLAGSSQISLKIKDSWFYYLIDNRTGTFYNTKLFDNAVGFTRQI